MANVADKVKQIRQAIYGRDVRESIASGIEAINAEVENTTSRQNVIDGNEDQRKINEETRINNENNRRTEENIRIQNENTRIQNEKDRQKAFNDSQELMRNENEKNQNDMKTIFQSNEASRKVDHATRQQEMLKDHQENQKKMKDEFVLNENTRQNTFDSREEERERWYTEFRNWYNEQANKGRFPINLDGGYFGEDDSSDKIYDGCNFGDS